MATFVPIKVNKRPCDDSSDEEKLEETQPAQVNEVVHKINKRPIEIN